METPAMPFSPKPASILLVEDSPGDVLLTKKALEKSGLIFTLHVAGDGIEAVEFLDTHNPPDIVLLDLNLPKMSGREVLEYIKTHTDYRKTPVIILTSSKAEEDILKSYDMHASGYMVKPGSPAELVELARSLGDYWFKHNILPRIRSLHPK